MEILHEFWFRLDEPVKRFICRFYVAFLGPLYLLLFVLGVSLTAKRAPFVDWYLQGELVPYFKLALLIMFIGFGSIIFGFFRLLFLTRTFSKKERLATLSSAIAIPAAMYCLALFAGPPIAMALRY